jgi:hypothetical protein
VRPQPTIRTTYCRSFAYQFGANLGCRISHPAWCSLAEEATSSHSAGSTTPIPIGTLASTRVNVGGGATAPTTVTSG